MSARGIEHPNDVTEDGFFDDSESKLLRHAGIADQSGDEEVAEARTGGFGCLAREEVVDFRVRGMDDFRVVRGEAEQ